MLWFLVQNGTRIGNLSLLFLCLFEHLLLYPTIDTCPNVLESFTGGQVKTTNRKVCAVFENHEKILLQFRMKRSQQLTTRRPLCSVWCFHASSLEQKEPWFRKRLSVSFIYYRVSDKRTPAWKPLNSHCPRRGSTF